MKIIILIVLLLSACSNPAPETPRLEIQPDVINEAPVETWVFSDPVEKAKPNTTYNPLFDGQTRVKSIITQESFAIELVDIRLESPWAIEITDQNMLLITERLGYLSIIKPDLSFNRLAIPLTLYTSGQGGLLDIALALDFNESRILYFSLSEVTSQGSTTALVRAQLNEQFDDFNTFDVLYRALPFFSGNNHYGSRVLVLNDGSLLMSIGDRQNFSMRKYAQDVNSGLGKIIHVDSSGLVIDNSLYFAPGILAMGLRNTQGLAYNRITGQILSVDMGPLGGDELNIIEAGHNYGWPILSYGLEYNGKPIQDGQTDQVGFSQPLYYWDPAIAPSGMAIYTHQAMSEWTGDVFIAALRGQHIVRLKLKDNRVLAEERLLSDLDQRFRDIGVAMDGWIYTITDQGRLYRFGPK